MRLPEPVKRADLHREAVHLQVMAGDCHNDTQCPFAYWHYQAASAISKMVNPKVIGDLSVMEITCISMALGSLMFSFDNRYKYLPSKDAFRIRSGKKISNYSGAI